MLVREGKQLIEQLFSDIEVVNSNGSDRIAQLTACVDLIATAQAALKKLVLDNEFASTDEEIQFFKSIKPQLISSHYFYSRCLFLEMAKPGAAKKDIKKFIEKEQRSIKRFYDFNQNIVQYYRSGKKTMDQLLFLRGVNDVPNWLVRLRFDQDERYSTAADHIISRILAYDKLSSYLSTELQISESEEPLIRPVRSMPWTGESINLVEMAYGIYFSKQLNNGKAGIGEIISFLEEIFEIKVGKPSRRFAEIKRRKRLSTTRFLDEMRDSLLRRIEDDEDFYTSPGGYNN